MNYCCYDVIVMCFLLKVVFFVFVLMKQMYVLYRL